MRYLSVKLPVVAALLLWAVATPADAAWILWANGPIDLSADQYEPRDYPVRSFLESSRCIQVLRGMEDGEPES
jgi:hypothetical protein